MANAALRCVELVLDGKVECVGLLDSGASFIAMREDTWRKLGSPLLADKKLVMGTANGTQSTSLGEIPRVCIVIGGFLVLISAQVVKNAPFDILLGRPFFQHCEAVTKDAANGYTKVVLHDPRTKEAISVPTFERTPGQCCLRKPGNQGF